VGDPIYDPDTRIELFPLAARDAKDARETSGPPRRGVSSASADLPRRDSFACVTRRARQAHSSVKAITGIVRVVAASWSAKKGYACFGVVHSRARSAPASGVAMAA